MRDQRSTEAGAEQCQEQGEERAGFSGGIRNPDGPVIPCCYDTDDEECDILGIIRNPESEKFPFVSNREYDTDAETHQGQEYSKEENKGYRRTGRGLATSCSDVLLIAFQAT